MHVVKEKFKCVGSSRNVSTAQEEEVDIPGYVGMMGTIG